MIIQAAFKLLEKPVWKGETPCGNQPRVQWGILGWLSKGCIESLEKWSAKFSLWPEFLSKIGVYTGDFQGFNLKRCVIFCRFGMLGPPPRWFKMDTQIFELLPLGKSVANDCSLAGLKAPGTLRFLVPMGPNNSFFKSSINLKLPVSIVGQIVGMSSICYQLVIQKCQLWWVMTFNGCTAWQARLRTDVRQRRADGVQPWNSETRLRQYKVKRKFKRPVFVFTPEQDCWTNQSYSRGGQETRHESRWHGLSEDGSRMTSSWLFFSCCTSWRLGLGHFSRITSPKPMEMTQSLAQFIYSKRSNFCFVFPSCTGCLLLFASIVYCLAALFNGSNFKSLRTGKIYSAYRL